jgi:hypothetical protein
VWPEGERGDVKTFSALMVAAAWCLAVAAAVGSIDRIIHGAGPDRSGQAVGDELVLRVGEYATVRSEAVSIRFDRVVEDSRCPVGVTCVWEGDAVVRLTVTQGKSTATIDLHVNARFERERVEGTYRIRLVNLLPRPVGVEPVDPAAYRAHIVVTRAQ